MFFCGEDLLGPHSTSMLENHPLSAVCDCLINIFAASLPIGVTYNLINVVFF